MSKKKSEFIGVGSVPSSYQFNCFVAGVDRRIPKEDLFQQIKDEIFAPFVYPTIELLQAADLEADDTNPTYVRCEETEYRLYKITNLAPSVDDISLTNGNTATFQVEYRDIGFVVGPATSVAGSLAVFTDTGGAQLGDLLVPTNAGKAFMQAADSAAVSFPRKNADNTVSMLGASTYFDAIKQVSAVGYSGTIGTASNASTLAQVATDEAITPANLAALKASNADVITGTDNVKYVTPETLQNKLDDVIVDLVQSVDTIADLRALTGLFDGQHINVASHTGGWAVTVPYRGPKGGGVFVAQASDVTSTDDNGKVIVTADGMRCIRNSNQVWVEDFGALGDGSTIDSVAIQAAHDSLPATGGQINFGEGKFVFDDPLEITKVGVNLVGRGIQASQLLPYSLATTSIIKIGNAGGVTLQLQMRDFGFRGFTTLAPIANWTGIAIDCTSYPLIDSIVENLWFSMSFDTPYCIKGVLSSSTIKNCIFELAGGSIYAHSVSGVGSVYNSVVEGCIFWRTIGAVRLGLGTGTRASLEIRDLDIGSHYSGAGIYVESGDLTASDIRFDVNTQWTGSTSRALRLDGGTANVSGLKVRKIVNGAAGSDLAEAIYMQGDSSLTLNGGSLHNATHGISSTSTGELIVNGTDLQDLSEHGIYPATNNLSRQIIKNATFTRIGLGAGANKDACRIKAAYGVVSGCTFYDDGTSLMRHVIIDSTTTTAEVLPDNTYFGGEGGSPVISSSTGCRAEFPLSAAPAFGSWAVGSMVRFTAPAAAGKIGSVCVTAGSPGTWKSYGAIDP